MDDQEMTEVVSQSDKPKEDSRTASPQAGASSLQRSNTGTFNVMSDPHEPGTSKSTGSYDGDHPPINLAIAKEKTESSSTIGGTPLSGKGIRTTPSSVQSDTLAQQKMEEGRSVISGSQQSLTSSIQRQTSQSSHGHSNRFDSPLSSVSRRRKFGKQQSIVCSVSHAGSSMNLSLHRGDSINSLHSDDSFHQPTHTVISPNYPVSLPPSVPTQTKATGRFSVSPAQSIPFAQQIKKKGKRNAASKSECSHDSSAAGGGRQSLEQEMQFEMSDMSLQEENESESDQDSDEEEEEEEDKDHEEPLLPQDSKHFKQKDISIPHKASEVTLENMDIDFDQIMGEVDENQITVQSRDSINTQDSATFEHAPLQCGNIRFVKDTNDLMSEPKKHYMCVKYDTPLEQVTEFMSKYWGMRNPKIVLSIISATENFKPWKSQRLKDDFQKGIIKAANTTEMWMITNGIDGGVSKYIGDAVSEYNIEQQNNHLLTNPVLSSHEQRRKRLTLIGIVPKDTVPYGIYFDGTEGVQIKNVGQKISGDIFELNPDHTHFVMVEDDANETTYGHLRCLIEKQFKHKTVRKSSKRRKRLMSIGSESEDGIQAEKKMDDPMNSIPVVGLLVQGTPKNIDQMMFYIQNKMPVVVLKGSGGLADMFGFVYEEFQEKGTGDPDYEENFLKPELIKMITRNYGSQFDDNDLGKFILRDKIIQCVKMASEGDGDTYMTVFSIKGWGASMMDLDKYILRALFKAQKHEAIGVREQLLNDLQLTIDWNRPDLAWEIFQQDFTRVRIDKKMFELCLLKQDREEFIDLFLTQGVKVHKYLNHRKLKYLFEKAADKEFFVNICLEGVLGIMLLPKQTLPENFIGEALNRLIYKLSWIRDFIQPYELSMSSTGHYVVNSAVAERKAINSLMIWAVLMNRHKLAKKLWNRCDEPIGVALICSRIFREMTKYTMEQYQRTELEENAKEFGQMALGALAICWRDSSIQAYNMLGRRLPDFNNKSVIEIAHDAGYIHFLAHPCCQKWLTKMFFGNLQVKELDWGLFRLPYWFKILVSAFFIFPMYLWITFIPPRKKKAYAEDDENPNNPDDSSSDGEDDDEVPHYSKSAFDRVMKKKEFGKRIKDVVLTPLGTLTRKKDVPFYMKIYLLWTAPITKFWTTQVFYFAFLGLFCLATLWPACGNQYIDLLLWAWTAVIEMELVCRVYMKYHKYKTLSLVGNCVDILLIMAFLIQLLVMRVLHGWMNVTNYIHAKTFMCYGLIYFFYRLLGVYLPISPTLGPMLLRMNRMVKHDFVAFIRMFLIFMIVGGVTIHSVIYPNWPLNGKMIRQVLTRPMYSMFLTPVQDLDGDPSCTPKYDNISGYCAMGQKNFEEVQGGSNDQNLVDSLAYCPYSSLSGYVITLQYLFICKLVLVTLLFAMFSLTIAKVDKEASEIWKFQRYALIADFIERFSLPPPFTVFSFIYMLLAYLWAKICWCKRQMRLSDCCFRNKIRAKKSHKSRVRVDDTMFWKRVAREYVAGEEAEAEKNNISSKHGDILIALQDDLKAHRKSMKRLGDRVVELERMVQSSRLCLEDIAHKLEKTEVMGITNVRGRFIHVAARQSPYPNTSITRFPVFDKYVPWEMAYDVYDPKTHTMRKDLFPEGEIIFVDVDIIELYHKKEERSVMNEEELSRMSPVPEFCPKWNSVETFREKGEKRGIDRRSWINFNDQPLRYNIDATLGIPLNPLGRTGMRGKGILWRWGPNHVIKAVCTRWRRKYGPDLNTMTDYLYVEGKRVLEFIAVQKDTYMDNSYGLPGGTLHGLSNPYSVLCRSFMSMVFDEQDTGQYKSFDQTETISFFAQFATALVGGGSRASVTVPDGVSANVRGTYYTAPYITESKSNLRVESDPQGFSANLLYKGYLDDPRNTDNAWVEAEVWNFHYDLGDNFDLRGIDETAIKWKEVSPYVKLFGNETVIVQEAARIHDAYH